MRGRQVKKKRDERKETGVNAEAEGSRDEPRWREREGGDEEERGGGDGDTGTERMKTEIES